ncbi:uncharacterized protein LOC124806494 [Hydra vulgaris]|uniref:uncharacterized protein LOC124806494 n=1 Tax=Hydra vulgaris TaxID=6087 RepID=UPI0032EA85ED
MSTAFFVEESIPISKKVKLLTPAPVTPKIFSSGTSMQLTPSKSVNAQMLTPLLLFTPPVIKSKINLIDEEQRSQEMLQSAVTNKIVSMLVELKEDVANLRKEIAYNTAMLQNIANGRVHNDDQNIFDILKLPLCNMAQLLQLEKTLENEKITMKKLIRAVASKGGQNLKKAVKRMLLSLLHNDILKKLNWTGQGDKVKQSFRDLNCRIVIEDALKRNLSTAQATESDIQKAIVHFLAGATNRKGERKARATRLLTLKAAATEKVSCFLRVKNKIFSTLPSTSNSEESN